MALSWPGVYRATGHFGSIELRVGERELGHLHGDTVADVWVPPQLIVDRVPRERQSRHDSGWVRIPLGTEEGVQQALALLRATYEHGAHSAGSQSSVSVSQNARPANWR
jgi:hypothetical protein